MAALGSTYMQCSSNTIHHNQSPLPSPAVSSPDMQHTNCTQ